MAKCVKCNRELELLFYSTQCNHCNNPPKGIFQTGYVVYLDDPTWEGEKQSIFRDKSAAEYWAQYLGLADFEIKMVLTNKVEWDAYFPIIGAPYIVENCTKDSYRIYKDHRFPEEEFTAFLAPEGTPELEIVTLYG